MYNLKSDINKNYTNKINFEIQKFSTHPNQKKYTQKDILSYINNLVNDNKLDILTLTLTNDLINNKLECQVCKKIISASQEVINCQNCFEIYHMTCFKDKLRSKSLLRNEVKFICKKCTIEIKYKNFPIYNCHCKKFNENQKKEGFNTLLIPHGCGLTCNAYICEHLSCTILCHPGPHEKCININRIECNCGKLVEEVKCGIEKKLDSCGIKCGKIMDCKKHYCKLTCHKGICICDECLDKPKNIKENIKTSIINIHGKINKYGPSLELDKEIVYCGRKNYQGGWKLQESIWGNPFKVKDFKSTEESIDKYEEYIRNKQFLMGSLNLLVGKKLACWCNPNPCHTQILIKIMKEKGLIDK